jgi:hypothetical protein
MIGAIQMPPISSILHCICVMVYQHVQNKLQHDSPDWCLKHTCLTCTYKLKDEAPLLFKMLYTVDGNDSLRRILQRSQSRDDNETLGNPSKLSGTFKVHGDRYLSHEYVDKWAHGVLQEILQDEHNPVDFGHVG